MSELLIIAGNAEPISWTLKDGQTPPQPINFNIGVWSASVVIKSYPAIGSPTLLIFSNANGGRGQLIDSKFIITPDPTVTSLITWTKAHYDAWLSGPNPSSEPILFDHGPVRVIF